MGEGCAICSVGSGSGIKIGGWVQAGYHSGHEPLSVANNDNLAFNDRPHRLNLHQGWLYAEKVADGSNGFDWGFRADVMYGTDAAAATQAFGNNPGRFDFQNGWDRGERIWLAMPQAYAEVASGDWKVKAGHFFTPVGYGSGDCAWQLLLQPCIHHVQRRAIPPAGALATYTASENVELYGGWTAGWDTGFDRFNGGSNFLGGAGVQASDDIKVTYITTVGNFGRSVTDTATVS